ncbi:MAG: hypothetical protein JXJ22_15235 [Bacteroidales bacterium]|nr:hypothetical protein [Bacteroidales bacterium]
MDKQLINTQQQNEYIESLVRKLGEKNRPGLAKGIKQVASFWTDKDGTREDFKVFCENHFITSAKDKFAVFKKISRNFEILHGNLNTINLVLKEPLHLEMGKIMPVDMMFGSYSPESHLEEDFFENKIAFYILLNFPHYSFSEKLKEGEKWTMNEWAMARLGDKYSSRVPAILLQQYADVLTKADAYISDYNIYAGKLVTDDFKSIFPEDLKLISHWGLRDELKSNYKAENGFQKQQMIYTVMRRIILQEIPAEVVNSDRYTWNPDANTLYLDRKKMAYTPEPDTRYNYLLQTFRTNLLLDPYYPEYSTYIKRKFDAEMEMPVEQVEKLFIELLSSPQVLKVAALIKQRLKRDLEPFDIWYNGFKPEVTIDEKYLDKIVKKKYPDKNTFEKKLPDILMNLGFEKDTASDIASKVTVNAARGAGHAWGAEQRTDKSYLRTRFEKDGMNYQGYNVAMHEFGHNVEQTISLHNVDEYLMHGVPNIAFTEALAFIFQKRDLKVLGVEQINDLKEHLLALKIFWSGYEIMGVSLVDIYVWKWLYEHKNTNAEELKQAVLRISREVWNAYFAPVFGQKDEILLAIYSHMIDYPLYLSAYPIGHLIDFQIEQYIKGKNFAHEIQRMYSTGCVLPNIWMDKAVGAGVSCKPLLKAVEEAINCISGQ